MDNTKTRILIVEDSEDDLDMYAEYLSLKGYQVSKARDGREGVGKAVELQPQLILTDLWLPVMSGWEEIQHLKADKRTQHIPILVITGHTAVRPLGCEGSLMKPCPLDQLDAEIAAILEARRGGLSPRRG